MVKFQVLQNFKLKTSRGILELYEGQTLEVIPEKVIRFVNTGKIKPIDKPEPQKPIAIEKVIGLPDMNHHKYPCKRCGKLAERFCYDIEHRGNPYCNWFCLKCEPYFPENN